MSSGWHQIKIALKVAGRTDAIAGSVSAVRGLQS
jgi:hypothetical protein